MKCPFFWPIVPIVFFVLLQKLPCQTPDTTRNNLAHAPGQALAEWGTMRFEEIGSGREALVFLPGWGFDAASFRPFFEKNFPGKRIFLATLPGYGGTAAYPMPLAGTSFSENNWMRGAEKAVLRLIETRKLERPALVAHFEVASHIALRLAAEHPEKFGKIALVGAPARHVFLPPRDTVSLAARVKAVDFYLAPKWFKTVTEATWRAGNFVPATYSLDSLTGARRFEEANTAPLPVQIGWLCELWAADFSIYEGVKNPVLVLAPTFTPALLADPKNGYLHWFSNDWAAVVAKNPNFNIQKMENSACNVMDDRPDDLRRILLDFLKN